jgi:general secretion pathway protein J
VRRASQGGFTLIELVLALVLLAGMLAMAWGGFSFALRAWEAGEANGTRTSDMRLAESFLRREITEIFPMRWKDPMTLKFAFEGDRERLRFVSARPPGITAPGLALVGLEVQEGDDRSVSLVMRRAAPDDDAKDFGPLENAEATVLIPGLKAVEFSYFGSDNDVNQPRWSDSWSEPGRMPLMVRVRLTGADGTPLPELVARLALGEEAGCLENTFQRICRPRRVT